VKVLLESVLRRINGELVVITTIILLTVIMSSVSINSTYAICKGLVSTTLTIGFAPVAPKHNQRADYVVSGYLTVSPSGPGVDGKIVKIIAPMVTGSTTTVSGGHYMFIIYNVPPGAHFKVIAGVGSDPIDTNGCPKPCSGSFCIQGSGASGILTTVQTG
jgi:hypothetical protein